MKDSVIKRSVLISGRHTSISLENAFWKALQEIADERDESISKLVSAINAARQHGNLSSAVRVFVLGFYRNQLSRSKSPRQKSNRVLGPN
jgi:predicted DNA-binding ribbon-helix-helix protein